MLTQYLRGIDLLRGEIKCLETKRLKFARTLRNQDLSQGHVYNHGFLVSWVKSETFPSLMVKLIQTKLSIPILKTGVQLDVTLFVT